MLSIENLSSAGAALGYYSNSAGSGGTSKYITESEWFGKGAEQLNLAGKISYADFADILTGQLPNGEELGRVNNLGNKEHAPGIDLTFSAPKSVSIAAEVMQDARVLKAHQHAVKTALEYVENNLMQTRVKVTGEVYKERVQNMTAALFTQHDSRAGDPQLHTHCVIANAVQKENGDWRSAFLKEHFDNKLLVGAIYRAELAGRLAKLGYEIEQGKNGLFELKEVPQELRDKFSNRSAEIKQIAKELGATSAAAKSEITKFTQADKKLEPYAKLQAKWQNTAAKFKLQVPPAVKVRSASAREHKEAVNFALKHLGERQTVFTRAEIIKTALTSNMGKVTLSGIEKRITQLSSKKELLTAAGGKSFTTKIALQREQKIIAALECGQNSTKAICTEKQLRPLGKTELNNGQQRAAQLILGSKDRVVGIQGYAGTGKTFMLKTAKEFAAKQGYAFIGLAPTGAAAKELERGGQMTTQTLQSFLGKYAGVAEGRGTLQGRVEMSKFFKDKMLVVDEASLISARQMQNLLTISEQLKVKMVLVGDVKQLGAVEAGKPFEIMQHAGMQTVQMSEILRQKNEQLKIAVKEVIREQSPERAIAQAFAKIGNNIIESSGKSNQDSKSMAEIAAKHYCALSNNAQAKTLVTAQANETRLLTNEAIRKNLIEQGVLGKEAHQQNILVSKALTEAEKSKIANYSKGDVLLLNRDLRALNLKQGSYLEVKKIEAKQGKLLLQGDKKLLSLQLNKLGQFTKNLEIYRQGIREFRTGDKVLFTRSAKEQGVLNSVSGQISKITKSEIHLKTDSGQHLSFAKDANIMKHLEHAYAVTVHRAQGKTISNVIGIMESWRKNLTTQKSFYVTISRAQNKATLITDNRQELAKSLAENTGYKPSALEHQQDKVISKGR